MKLTTSWERVTSKDPSPNGSASAAATHDLDARQPRAAGFHERLRGLRSADASRAETVRERGRERTGAAADVEGAHALLHTRELDQSRGQRRGIAPDESVVGVG